jgi:hypothetical protein
MTRICRDKLWFLITLCLVITSGCSDSREKVAIGHFLDALQYRGKAVKIINAGEPFSIMTTDDSEEVSRFYELSLSSATKADVDILNSIYPEFGSRFKDDYIGGLKMFLEAGIDANGALTGQIRMDRFGKWYTDHADIIKIRIPRI